MNTLAPPPAQAGTAAQGKPVSVVLVEDDTDLREGLAGYLRLSGIKVTDVDSALSLYKALRGTHFDIAILDVNLPDISGFQLADELAREEMGVIMLTARTAREDRVRAYTVGADLYLTKPVDSEELVLAIRNLARRVGTKLETTRVAAATAGWQLELLTHRLSTPEGKVIALSGRETMLLEHLGRAQGATVTRNELSSLLGYDDNKPESRSLDVVLRRLRQKAQDVGTILPLQVMHAVGIRFSGPITIV